MLYVCKSHKLTRTLLTFGYGSHRRREGDTVTHTLIITSILTHDQNRFFINLSARMSSIGSAVPLHLI